MQDGGERKRDRSDESCEASIESEMTKAQMQTCKKLVANGAKYQALSFNPTMTTFDQSYERASSICDNFSRL
jgi:hypothetical protein